MKERSRFLSRFSSRWFRSAIVALTLAGFTALHAQEAEARRFRMSGGYSKVTPKIRTPSFSRSTSSYTKPRTPSMASPSSGGYAKPRTASPSVTRSAPRSAGDRSISRERSGGALDQFRRETTRPATSPSTSSGSVPPTSRTTRSPRRTYDDQGGRRTPTFSRYDDRNFGFGSNTPSFGVWDSIFLWTMLNNLNSSFFHNHRSDPGVQQWRQEAERLAEDNSELRQKLNRLDSQLVEKSDEPVDEDFLPAGKSPGEAYAAPVDARTPSVGQSEGFGFLSVIVLLLILAGLCFWLFTMVRAKSMNRRRTTGSKIDSTVNLVRDHLDRDQDPYRPDYYRVGMVIEADPTPFILAGDAVRVALPTETGSMVVRSLSRLRSTDSELLRLYIDDAHFFQLHLGPDGKPDECRYFQAFDEVVPASSDEWSFWLAEEDGSVGLPEFQTRDGQLYQRVWAPSDQRIRPVEFSEQYETDGPMRLVRRQMMLYSRDTGLPDPAPTVEYILLSVVEESGNAWVQVNAGIDVNPASLSLV